ncbi:MAG TPA: tRNA (adenosine(37)-N6)-threonylcarbamoyltransferase complex dimerization subunit type 1 TsaB [Sphingomicrobium sp.]|jgi:tRNA threonylcarbamoyl adenosine modification protein YeaZ|nr:tRNA (adenosine(37)-N6)-threonylcarbamoyltransferase complex dimerization subunit type 1 TsaB [Sphingomicrobium sp.]
MILALDTSTAACTAALFDESGECVARADELIGRGHAERLAPMLAELLDGRRADTILVGTGPGSFTGIRVGIAAAHGLAIGWDAKLFGMSSLGLLAASSAAEAEIAAAMNGGHGELFVQQFGRDLDAAGDILNLAPAEAAKAISADIAAGPGAQALIDARGYGRAVEAWPSAANAMRLPERLRSLAPVPVYARAPDAKTKSAA